MNRRGLLFLRILLTGVGAFAIAACNPGEDPAATTEARAPAAALEPIAGIQDIMAYMIDPAADFLWASVSTTVTATGTTEKEPRTNEEWDAVRKQAILLTEGAALIAMDGRPVARQHGKLEDQGTPGNLTALESQRAIANDRAAFLAFARALHDVGHSMLKAIDARSPQGMLESGDTLDRVCEGCHLKFWYPGQKIPQFPGQAPEE